VLQRCSEQGVFTKEPRARWVSEAMKYRHFFETITKGKVSVWNQFWLMSCGLHSHKIVKVLDLFSLKPISLEILITPVTNSAKQSEEAWQFSSHDHLTWSHEKGLSYKHNVYMVFKREAHVSNKYGYFLLISYFKHSFSLSFWN
jgi:hypothetical protein